MKELVARLNKWKKGKEAPPQIAQVHLTNKCNLSCGFCPTVASKEKNELNLDNELNKKEWKRIISEGNEIGIKEWHICGGGEPLFDKDTALDIMEEMKKNGARGELITNGTLVDKEASKRIIKMDWDLVTFSLDGPDKKTNDSIRSDGSFLKVIRNAKYLSSIRRNEKPYLVIHTVLCNKNYDKTREIVKLVNKIGFDEIRFNSMNVWNKTGEKLKLDDSKKEVAKTNLIKAKKIAEEKGIETNIDEFMEHNLLEHSNEIDQAMRNEVEKNKKGFTNLSCYYPWYNVSIFADGRTAPCFLFHDGVNIKNKSLKDVWLGDFFNNVRKRFSEDRLKGVCKNCNAWNVEKMNKIRRNL